MVKLFLAHHADINLVDQHNRTALDIAGARGYTEIVALLENYSKK